MLELPLPVLPAILKMHVSKDDPFFPIALLAPEEARQVLRKAWTAIEHPVLRRIASGLLQVPVASLSSYNGRSYLGLRRWAGSGPGSTFWIAGLRMKIPQSLRTRFPLKSFEPLEEFLIHFGGLNDSLSVDHSGDFLHCRDFYLISAHDRRRDFGLVDDSEGSLPFYHGGSGDMIVLAPDGRVGTFLHEYAANERECPFAEVDHSLTDLLSHYAEYIRLPEDSPKRIDSCFY